MKDKNSNTSKTNLEKRNILPKITHTQLKVYDWLAGITNSSDPLPFNIVEVKFKGSRKEFYLNSDNLNIKQEDIVVVQASSGHDIGIVSLTGELVRLQMKKKDIRIENVMYEIYRKADLIDCNKWKESKELESDTMYKSRILANDLSLRMKICDVAYQGDLSRATFYYTAENRVDFRVLILVLAKTFNIKIVMRQISQIEEIRRLGGVGTCGREYCFSLWQSYKKSNKNQWSEFKCCLIDEPKIGKTLSRNIDFENIQTQKGIARMKKKDIDKKIIWYSYPNDDHLIPLTIVRVNELQMLIKEGMPLMDLNDEAVVIEKFGKTNAINYSNTIGEDSITRFDKKHRK
jgi:cell fate regulator YaaT (PSP1 superfamily)